MRSITSFRNVTARLGAGALVVASLLMVSGPAHSQPVGASRASATAPDPVQVALEHLRERADKYGLSQEDVKGMTVSSVVPTEHNGLTNVYLQQQVNSIDVFDAMVNVTVTSDGKVMRVASSAVGSAAKLANSDTPGIAPEAAAHAAAQALGLHPTSSFASADHPTGPDQAQLLRSGGISADRIPVHLVYQPTASGALRLTWELGINELSGKHWWQARIDAQKGTELDKNDWVAYDGYNVFPRPTEAPSFGSRSVVSNPATSASPFGWHDTNGVAGPESTLTSGNNVNAYTDTNADNFPDPGSQPNGGGSLLFDFPLDLTQQPAGYVPAAVTNLFYWNNTVHDVFYRYGFNEASGDFQLNNYGHGGTGADPVNAEAQDGSGIDNANFATPPDGASPRMQMFLWDTASPQRDGDLDAGVIVHEYGHGISNRLTGGPANTSCLGNQEQGGEGWSDFFAYMLTMPSGVEPPGGRGIGTYVLNQPTTGAGIRTQKYSTDMAVNNETYDSIKTAVAPHGVGEVWAEMLWEVTWALIHQYGYSPDLVNGNAGNTMALQLVVDGLKLQPCSPGFVDARDAIIAADQADNGGANRCLLWTAFAKRGLGVSASEGSTGSKTDGVQAFDIPADCHALQMTRTDTPDPVTAGGQITYGFQLTNNSAGTLNGVTANSTLGNHTAFLAGSATCGGTYDGGTNTVTFPVGTLAAGATKTCSYKVTVDSTPYSHILFQDDFEPDLSAWTTTHAPGTANDWALVTTTPNSPTHAAFASDPNVVSDQYLTLAAPVTVGSGDQLSFMNKYGLESGFDGGVVEISTNGGASWTDLGPQFTQNGYTGTISGSFSSPIAGRPAFTGTRSSYLQSVADLTPYAGQSVLVRFRMASDISVAATGWWVDDVSIGNQVVTLNSATASAPSVSPVSETVSTTINAPVANPPSAPTVTSTTPAPGQATVAFTPGSDGGSPVTNFTAQCVSTDGGITKSVGGSSSPITVTGLSDQKSYHCHVRATNAVGTGPFSAYGATVVLPPATAPAAPSVTSTTPGAGQATVAFTPGFNGGSPVTNFTAQCVSSNGGVTRSAGKISSPITVKGLTPLKSYQCHVRATNAIGTGAWSAFGATVTPTATPPAAPTVTSTTPSGAGRATVAFTPGSDGGSPITSFTAQCVSTDGGVTRSAGGAASPITVTGMTVGKSYHCKVRANNAIGTGTWSAYGTNVVIAAAKIRASATQRWLIANGRL